MIKKIRRTASGQERKNFFKQQFKKRLRKRVKRKDLNMSSLSLQVFIRRYIKTETFSGLLLIAIALVALIIANIPQTQELYNNFIHLDIAFQFGNLGLSKSLSHWVNDALMVIFFLLVGLEIKREIVLGELSDLKKASFPLVGAIGGVIVPALIYTFFTYGTDVARGWAIPTATDIAFALGLLALLGSRVPLSLKIFLTTLAVIDDLMAILIIAVFYTEQLDFYYLSIGAVLIAILVIIGYLKVFHASLYFFFGFLLWIAFLNSGIHATLAGVITAFCVPVTYNKKICPLTNIEHKIHNWVIFFILPIFAFVNSGVKIPEISLELITPISLGIVLGLFAGKQIGIFIPIFILSKLGFISLPKGMNYKQVYGVSILCGVGFTMSLFVGGLSFGAGAVMEQVRLSVIVVSVISGIVGITVLKLVLPKK